MDPRESTETAGSGDQDRTVFTEEMESVVAIERVGMQRPYRKGQKEHAIIRAGFPDETRYYALLNVIIDNPEAARRWPGMVRMLRDRRAYRQGLRSGSA